MTNNSYYDDINSVASTLNRVELFHNESEIINESYNHLKSVYEKFCNIANLESPISEEFIKSHEELTSAYIAFENIMHHYDSKCKVTHNERQRIIKISFFILDKRSSLVKSKELLNQGIISPESIVTINRLRKESSTIGFRLDEDERNIISMVEEYINEL